MRSFEIKPIGIVRSPLKTQSSAPIQPRYSEFSGEIEVYDEFAEGLKDIDGFSHITVIFVFDRSEDYELLTYPYLGDEKRGVFATRSPYRPNRLGVSVLKLLEVEGNILRVDKLDMLDGTPIVDIKPFVKGFVEDDSEIRNGWLDLYKNNTDGLKKPRDKELER